MPISILFSSSAYRYLELALELALEDGTIQSAAVSKISQPVHLSSERWAVYPTFRKLGHQRFCSVVGRRVAPRPPTDCTAPTARRLRMGQRSAGWLGQHKVIAQTTKDAGISCRGPRISCNTPLHIRPEAAGGSKALSSFELS